MITTRNRKADLRRALFSCISQDYPALGISVYDDCSEDGTAELVRTEFPQVIVRRSSERLGLVTLRNRAYQETNASYVLSLDDDAWLTNRSTVGILVRQIESDPKVSALAIPYLEVPPMGRAKVSCAIATGAELRSYVGTAHLCRVRAVRDVGGYRDLLVHQGEERDLCIRLRAAGWSIRMAFAPPIVHAVSPSRDLGRMQRYGVRNQVLYDFFYAPWFIVPIVTIRHIYHLVRYRLDVRWALTTLLYTMEGVRDCWRYRQYRTPWTIVDYLAHIRLPVHGPRYVECSDLPPPC